MRGMERAISLSVSCSGRCKQNWQRSVAIEEEGAASARMMAGVCLRAACLHNGRQRQSWLVFLLLSFSPLLLSTSLYLLCFHLPGSWSNKISKWPFISRVDHGAYFCILVLIAVFYFRSSVLEISLPNEAKVMLNHKGWRKDPGVFLTISRHN